jgi:hypothetical protein
MLWIRSNPDRYLMALLAVLLAIIAVTVAVRTMVVLYAAALTLPIAVIITLSIVAGPYPARSTIGRATPISIMPAVVAIDRVPIAVHPNIIGTRGHWANRNHARRRWGADPDSKRYFGCENQSDSQQ